ncbi:MAG TPA: hypothetical protein VF269_06605 [Rhodanobacteraceae bacterium]
MKRLPSLLLVASALLLLGGCAIEPAYRYDANNGGGYYAGQSAYGNANTVIRTHVDINPWGWGYGPGWWGYGPGWWGYNGLGFGATYVYRPHHRWHQWDHHRDRAWRGSDRYHDQSRGHSRSRTNHRHSPTHSHR